MQYCNVTILCSDQVSRITCIVASQEQKSAYHTPPCCATGIKTVVTTGANCGLKHYFTGNINIHLINQNLKASERGLHDKIYINNISV